MFEVIDLNCREEVVIATNTATLSVTDIAGSTKRPDKVVGMKFFNPAQSMRLVEIVRGMKTSEETIEKAKM